MDLGNQYLQYHDDFDADKFHPNSLSESLNFPTLRTTIDSSKFVPHLQI
jgi:hypothetical protein